MTFAFACIFYHKATRLLAFGPFSFSMGLVFFKFSHGRSLFDEHAKRPSLANLMAGLELTKILSAVKRARGDDFGDANWNTRSSEVSFAQGGMYIVFSESLCNTQLQTSKQRKFCHTCR